MNILEQVIEISKTFNLEETIELYTFFGLKTNGLDKKTYPKQMKITKALKMYNEICGNYTNEQLIKILNFVSYRSKCEYQRDVNSIYKNVFYTDNIKTLIEKIDYIMEYKLTCCYMNKDIGLLCTNCKTI